MSSLGGTEEVLHVSTAIAPFASITSESPFFSPPAPVYTVGSPSAVCRPVLGLTQVSWSADSGSTLNAIASILFVPTARVGTGAIGVVCAPSPCPQLNKPPVPLRLTVVNPAWAAKPVGQPVVELLLVGPVFAQSYGGSAEAMVSLTLPSPPALPDSMKLDGGVAETFMAATTSVTIPNASSAPKRAGWRAISVKLFDNSITSFWLVERAYARLEWAFCAANHKTMVHGRSLSPATRRHAITRSIGW